MPASSRSHTATPPVLPRKLNDVYVCMRHLALVPSLELLLLDRHRHDRDNCVLFQALEYLQKRMLKMLLSPLLQLAFPSDDIFRTRNNTSVPDDRVAKCSSQQKSQKYSCALGLHHSKNRTLLCLTPVRFAKGHTVKFPLKEQGQSLRSPPVPRA